MSLFFWAWRGGLFVSNFAHERLHPRLSDFCSNLRMCQDVLASVGNSEALACCFGCLGPRSLLRHFLNSGRSTRRTVIPSTIGGLSACTAFATLRFSCFKPNPVFAFLRCCPNPTQRNPTLCVRACSRAPSGRCPEEQRDVRDHGR